MASRKRQKRQKRPLPEEQTPEVLSVGAILSESSGRRKPAYPKLPSPDADPPKQLAAVVKAMRRIASWPVERIPGPVSAEEKKVLADEWNRYAETIHRWREFVDDLANRPEGISACAELLRIRDHLDSGEAIVREDREKSLCSLPGMGAAGLIFFDEIAWAGVLKKLTTELEIAIRDAQALTGGDGGGKWLMVSQAARVANVNSGVISNAASNGKLKSNGKTRRERRIDSADLARWQLERADTPERAESDAQVKRLVKKHVKS